MKTTYSDAGVSIDAGNDFVDNITPLIKKTARPEVMAPLGGYAGLFKLDLKKYPDPVLVSTTDGVGTKLKLAFETGIFTTVGQDLVGMCVNDLICCGAEPLFFLDYFATGKLELKVAEEVVRGIVETLKDINCSLIGGETAEMPGFYAKGEFDIAGFAVGVVNQDRIVDGKQTKEGDAVIGLASSGVHSNGFSLVRKILEKNKIDPSKNPIGRELLTPTRIYVNPVLSLLKKFSLKGIAHITGGGLVENIPRVLPDSLAAHIEKKNVPVHPLFRKLQEMGGVPEEEMWRVFNMGVGLVIVSAPSDEKSILAELKKMNYPACRIGTIIPRPAGNEGVVL
ncbi:MAG: phosphoribosylformylglycinamidine cyclo-ligase [Deltaproteobacteria bacterium]|nr:phosphoribosylformylglycinamidine cyclo-ligase [Deltaproteobacteria bacterium]